MKRYRRIVRIILACVLACIAQGGPRAAAHGDNSGPSAGELEKILKLIPPDTKIAVVVPNLKTLSDQLVQLLEGTDRVNLLMGSRPIDQLKSTTGFNVAVDDKGGFAIAMKNLKLNQEESESDVLFIVPVTDAAAFLEGNFTGHEGDRYTLADGTSLYAKSLGSHVVLSQRVEAAQAFDPGQGIAQTMADSLGERGQALRAAGELFVFAAPGAPAELTHQMKAAAAEAGQPVPLTFAAGGAMLEHAESGLFVLDLDPLGAIIHTLGTLSAQSALAGGNAQSEKAEPSPASLSQLPNKPFYFAGSIDVAGLGGADSMRAIARLTGATEPPPWLAAARSAQFAAYPSPAGLAGGLLNDAALVLNTPEPAQAKDAFRQHVLAMQNPPGEGGMVGGNGITYSATWEEPKDRGKVAGAEAYEVKITKLPSEAAQLQMIEKVIFGPKGWRGFVKQTESALIVTFSQRPAVLEAAVETAAVKTTAAEKSAPPATVLASNAAIRMMRTWMPADADVELYLGVGQLSKMVKQVADSLGGMLGADDAAWPEIDASLPPVGFAVELDGRTIETATVVPAGVLAVMADQGMRFTPAPNVELLEEADDNSDGVQPR